MTSTLVVAPAKTSSTECQPLEKSQTAWRCGDHAISIGVKDEDLARLFWIFRDQGILDLMFYQQAESLKAFLDLFLKPQTNTLGCFWKNPETDCWQLEGLCFIRDVLVLGGRFQRSDVGEGFVRGAHNPLLYGQLCLEYAFAELGMDAVMGITPFDNRAARIFPLKVGMTVVGPVHGGCIWKGNLADVMVSSITKEQWKTKRPWGEF